MKDFFLPFKGVFCRVEPLAFDGTLSFLECLAKLQDYVNKLNANITAINALIEAIEAELEGKQDTLTFDTTPTDGSTNPVTSDGIFDALAEKQDNLTFDTTPTNGSTNPVTSDGIFDALAEKQDNLTFDTTPTNGSTNPVTSDGIFDALAEKQDNLTFDSAPTNGSTNPVTSDGIFDAIQTAIGTAVNYTNNREQTIRDDMAAMFYTVELASSQVTALPTGITYSSINNTASNGKLVRVHVVAENWWYYYTEPCRFFRTDIDNGEIAIIDIDTHGNVRFDSFV